MASLLEKHNLTQRDTKEKKYINQVLDKSTEDFLSINLHQKDVYNWLRIELSLRRETITRFLGNCYDAYVLQVIIKCLNIRNDL